MAEAVKILEFKSQEELIYAFTKGSLYGTIPAVKIDSNKLTYPVKIELFTELKTFRLYTEPKPAKQETQTPPKKKLSKGAIAGIVIGCVCAVALIVGLIVWLV